MDVIFLSTEKYQIGNDGHADGFFDPVDVPGDLVLPQSQATFELFAENLDRPPSLVDGKHQSCGQLEEIGHQHLCVFRAHVTPFLAQNHGDVTDMIQASAFSKHPEGLAALDAGWSWNPGPLKNDVWHVFDQKLASPWSLSEYPLFGISGSHGLDGMRRTIDVVRG
jgi:hypothetical protein